jgi:hypothetical protein
LEARPGQALLQRVQDTVCEQHGSLYRALGFQLSRIV